MTNQITQNFLEELGLNNLPEDKKIQLLDDVGRMIQQNVIFRVIEVMNESDKDEFDRVIGENMDHPEAILNFLKAKVPNFETIVSEEVEKFKKESVEFIKGLSSEQSQ